MTQLTRCPTVGSNLDPPEYEAELMRLAEEYLGGPISPPEWFEAKKYAEHKLDGIIKREGDLDGARREPWYLAKLIEETVRANRFSQFTLELADLYRYAEAQAQAEMGLKKGQPASKDADHPNRCNPIVAQTY